MPRSDAHIAGAGATFPAPLYERWALEYGRETGVSVAYRASGSSDGILAITTDRTDFAGTDAPMTDDQLDQAGDVLHVPMTLGAVAIAYNVPDVPNELKLDGPTLSGIFQGDVRRWNDPAIRALNPDVKLPDHAIVLVTRADGSGTTKVFTEFLAAASPSWKEKVGTSPLVRWPSGYAVQHNDGVADTIRRKRGAIGYLQSSFAMSRRLDVALIKNAAGEFCAPSVEGARAAAAGAAPRMPGDLRLSIVNADGKDAYPISGFSYLLIRKEAPEPKQSTEAVRFAWWGLHDGQKYGPALGYAELPPAIVQKSEAKLKEVQFRGKQLFAGS